MKTSVVTGAAGFLGSHVTRRLLDEGRRVVALDNFATPGCSIRQASLGGGPICWGIGDISAPGIMGAGAWLETMTRGLDVDEVWHMASPASPRQYKSDQLRTLRLGGSVLDDIISWAHARDARVLFASSSEVYGDPETETQSETQPSRIHPTGPRSCYDAAKVYGEAVCTAWSLSGADVKIARIFNCYDGQTEVLTDAGFVRFDALSGDERFATRTPEGAIEYHPASEYVAAPFVGEALHFEGRHHDLFVTPNHRMLVDRGTGPEILPAHHVADRGSDSWRFIRGGSTWSGDAILVHQIPAFEPRMGRGSPERRILMGDWCEFMGWFLSEGSAFVCGKNREHRIVITQRKDVHPENYKRITSLIRRMGYHPYLPRSQRDVFVCSVQLYRELDRQTPFGSANKRIPRWMLNLAQPYLWRLFESLMAGDGSADLRTYTTRSPGLADDVVELAFKLGLAAQLSFDGTCYKVGITRPDSLHGNRPRIGIGGRGVGVKRVPFDGMVYDVTVPNHLLLVRRNGKTCWSGNTYGPGQLAGDGRLVPAMIGAALTGEAFVIHGDGSQKRTLGYVSDTVDGLFRVMRDATGMGPINVGGQDTISIIGLMNLVRDIVGPFPIRFGPRQDEHDPVRRRPDLGRLRALGWSPSMPLAEGLGQTAAWMRLQR